MNDPLELEEQRMLAAARQAHAPDTGAAARVRLATLTALAVPAPPGAPGALDVLWHAPGKGIRLLAAAALAAGSAAVGYGAAPHAPQTPPAAAPMVASSTPKPASAPAPAARQEPAAAPPEVEAENTHDVTGEPERPARPQRMQLRATADAKGDGLQRELRALKRIESEQRAGHAEQALRLLERLDRELPEGRLLEERRAAYVIARCTVGTSAPGALVEDFVAAFPHSVYTPRLRRRCIDGSP